MPKWHVNGRVTGSKYLGCFEAATAQEAEEKALNSDAGCVSLCHACAEQCEDAEVEVTSVEPAGDDEPVTE